MAVTIGRASGLTLDTAGIRRVGATIEASGYLDAEHSSLGAALIAATIQHLTGLAEPGEEVVPILVDEDVTVNGYYRVASVEVAPYANSPYSLRWAIAAERVDSYANPQFEGIATLAAISNAHSLPTSVSAGRIWLPGTDLREASPPGGSAGNGFNPALAIADEDIGSTLWPATNQTAGTKRWYWYTPPDHFYDGAATIEVLDGVGNKLLNASFDADIDADGRADGWTFATSGGTASGTSESIGVGGVDGGRYQNFQATLTAGQRRALQNWGSTASQTVSPGDVVCLSGWARGTASSYRQALVWYDSSGSIVGSINGDAGALTDDWARYSVVDTAPANSFYVEARCAAVEASGGTVDVDIDRVCLVVGDEPRDYEWRKVVGRNHVAPGQESPPAGWRLSTGAAKLQWNEMQPDVFLYTFTDTSMVSHAWNFGATEVGDFSEIKAFRVVRNRPEAVTIRLTLASATDATSTLYTVDITAKRGARYFDLVFNTAGATRTFYVERSTTVASTALTAGGFRSTSATGGTNAYHIAACAAAQSNNLTTGQLALASASSQAHMMIGAVIAGSTGAATTQGQALVDDWALGLSEHHRVVSR